MHNKIKTTLLLICLTVLMIAVGQSIGGRTGVVFAFFMACGMNLSSCWFSDRMVLPLYKAQEVTEADQPALAGTSRTGSARWSRFT